MKADWPSYRLALRLHTFLIGTARDPVHTAYRALLWGGVTPTMLLEAATALLALDASEADILAEALFQRAFPLGAVQGAPVSS